MHIVSIFKHYMHSVSEVGNLKLVHWVNLVAYNEMSRVSGWCYIDLKCIIFKLTDFSSGLLIIFCSSTTYHEWLLNEVTRVSLWEIWSPSSFHFSSSFIFPWMDWTSTGLQLSPFWSAAKTLSIATERSWHYSSVPGKHKAAGTYLS